MRLHGRLAILLALALTLAFGACAEGQTLQAYLDGYAPEGVMVVAYEVVNPDGERMNFDAIPLDDEPGDVSDPNSNLAIAQRLFDSLQYEEVEKDEWCNDEHWHFAIEYGICKDSMDRTVRLDFYDYVSSVYLRIYDSGIGKPIYEAYIQIPLEASYEFEDIYLNTVAALRRPLPEYRSIQHSAS